MALSARAPTWLTWALAGALAAVFLGERPLHDDTTLRWLFSGAGVLFVLFATGWRVLSWSRARGQARRVERILLLGYAGVMIALGMYFARVGLAPDEPSRMWSALGALWPILLACSAAPALMAQWAVGPAAARAGSDADEAQAEAHRVSELATSALTVAMAASFLGLVMFIAHERDEKWDVSYFKTSSPGSATINMVNSLDEPLEVLVFFPAVNEVKDEVMGYFQELSSKTGNINLREVDRLVEMELAKEHRVTKDGTIVLVKGDQSRTITLETEMKRARAKLRDFDSEVQKAFMKVAREAQTAYFVVGHGEMNDPGADRDGKPGPLESASAVRDLLGLLNYRVKDLGLRQGLAQDVPDDASLVLLLGPEKALLPEELAALDRYLARGGAMLIALEPGSEASLGPLEARLGLKFVGAPLADDKQFVPQRRNDSDHQNIVTDQFSAHASVTTLSRARVGSGILLLGAGSLEDAEWAADFGEHKPKRTYTVRSLASTFRDENESFTFDDGVEKRQSYNLVAAVEGAEMTGPDAKESKRMRAVVLADTQLLSDGVLLQVQLNRGLVLDVLKWLGGEEKYTGEVTSEKDVPIQHTKGQDVAWFYATIAGVPLLVLSIGGVIGQLRRRRSRRRKS